ncbi:WD40 repeat domain-containing protein [Sporobolomyces salmoneus]|uniref:WD40 repeat domain-containing protein n=1 Tax=Sporobolomyces salmoneus TaxID=183962 RepID=UPI0031762B7F
MAVTSTDLPPPPDFTKYTTRRLGNARERVRTLAWNQDGRRLATGGTDKILRIYLPEKDPRTATECRGHAGEIQVVKWNPTHPERLATCAAGSDKALNFWDIRQGSKPTSSVETHGENITMTWSPNGQHIVLGNRSDRIMWIDVEDQKVIRKEDMTLETNEAAFSNNGSLLLTTIVGRLNIHTFPANEKLHSVNVSPVATMWIDLDPRGRYLVAAGNDTTVTLWETSEWTCVSSLGCHDDPIRACRFSHDGAYIASASGYEIIISEVPSLKEVHKISLPPNSLCDTLAWHPSKHMLAYGAGDAYIWGLGV